ncbi:hypothetical protein N9C31_04645 [Gammaproteobacteria bacterium]|nr:hypothetical protein [Gammaproteobacteria bacterium]
MKPVTSDQFDLPPEKNTIKGSKDDKKLVVNAFKEGNLDEVLSKDYLDLFEWISQLNRDLKKDAGSVTELLGLVSSDQAKAYKEASQERDKLRSEIGGSRAILDWEKDNQQPNGTPHHTTEELEKEVAQLEVQVPELSKKMLPIQAQIQDKMLKRYMAHWVGEGQEQGFSYTAVLSDWRGFLKAHNVSSLEANFKEKLIVTFSEEWANKNAIKDKQAPQKALMLIMVATMTDQSIWTNKIRNPSDKIDTDQKFVNFMKTMSKDKANGFDINQADEIDLQKAFQILQRENLSDRMVPAERHKDKSNIEGLKKMLEGKGFLQRGQAPSLYTQLKEYLFGRKEIYNKYQGQADKKVEIQLEIPGLLSFNKPFKYQFVSGYDKELANQMTQALDSIDSKVSPVGKSPGM